MSGNDVGSDEQSVSGPSRIAPKVLVIESVRSTRELMALVLQRHYRTQTAATYEQALRRVRSTQFDGILLSVNLRGVQAGIEMVQELRALDAYADVTVIAVIGPSLDEGQERLAAAGSDGFLRMPFVRSDLLGVLREHLEDAPDPEP